MPAKRGDWDAFAAEVVTACAEAVGVLAVMGRSPVLHGSHWWGSSDEFRAEIRKHFPHLSAPEGDVVLLEGPDAWDPGRETPPPPGAPCPHCGDSIGPGSLLYCPKCSASGFDTRLGVQRKMAGPPVDPPPPPEDDLPWVEVKPQAPPKQAAAAHHTRRQRRAAHTHS
jgi:hypothetical protein